MMSLEDKLAKLDDLRAKRAEIDAEIMALFGEARQVIKLVPDGKKFWSHKKNKFAPNFAQKKCCGSKGPRHKKDCVNSSGKEYIAPPRFDTSVDMMPKPSRALSGEEYEYLRLAMKDKEFQSAAYALTHKLSPREVNKAIRSTTYEEYIEMLD